MDKIETIEFTAEDFINRVNKYIKALKEEKMGGFANVTETLLESDVIDRTVELTDAWNKWIEKLEEQGFELTVNVLDKRWNESPHTMPFLIPAKAQKVFFRKEDE